VLWGWRLLPAQVTTAGAGPEAQGAL